VTTGACLVPIGYTGDNTDCYDGSGTIYPDALELCNGWDDDCDTTIDESYLDSDSDGQANCVEVGTGYTCMPYYPQYDYNDDGVLDTQDMSLLTPIILNVEPYYSMTGTELQKCEVTYVGKDCDLNDSATLTTFDVVRLGQIIAGTYDA